MSSTVCTDVLVIRLDHEQEGCSQLVTTFSPMRRSFAAVHRHPPLCETPADINVGFSRTLFFFADIPTSPSDSTARYVFENLRFTRTRRTAVDTRLCPASKAGAFEWLGTRFFPHVYITILGCVVPSCGTVFHHLVDKEISRNMFFQ